MVNFSGWKGLTKDNHLGSIQLLMPQKATNLMVQLLAWHRGKTLNTFLSKFPTKTFDSDDEYTWDVIGSSDRNIPLVEARNENGTPINSDNGTDNIGVAGSPFYLVFAKDWFALGEVIVGDLNEVYPIRIVADPRREGTNTVYKVTLTGGITTGIPRARLQAGERFSVEYAPVSHGLSRKVGDIRFTSPVSMRNEFTTIRIQHKVPGNMLDKKIAVGIPMTKVVNGKLVHETTNMWMNNVHWQLECQWDQYKNRVLAFGKSNRTVGGEYLDFDFSGEILRMGSGLYQQMEVSNTTYYNTFSLKAIEDALYYLSAAKLDFGERTFIIRTGELGAILFHKAVKNEVSGWLPFEIDNSSVNVVQKVTSNLHQNALSAGYQFTEWRAPNGVTVKIEVDPYYDDPVRNKITLNGRPAFSARFDIFDIGSMDQPNIFKVAVKGQEGDMTSIQWGLRDPYTGKMGNPNMSFDEDAAVIHKMTTTGICVLDPSRTVSLIPRVLQG